MARRTSQSSRRIAWRAWPRWRRFKAELDAVSWGLRRVLFQAMTMLARRLKASATACICSGCLAWWLASQRFWGAGEQRLACR